MSAAEYERIWRETNEEVREKARRPGSRHSSDIVWNRIFNRKIAEARRGEK